MSSPERKRRRVEEGTSREGPTKTSPQTNVCDWNTQKFCEIVQCPAFVDKTKFIKAFLESKDGVIVALAPRRFGKSTNMNMLQEFLTGNKKLFQDKKLEITKDENFFNMHCHKNPVIYASFKKITAITFDGFLRALKELMRKVFNEHQYLIEEIDGKYSWSDPKLKVLGSVAQYENYWKNPQNLYEEDVMFGLNRLSECLYMYYGKPVYVLIDEFDSPIMKMIVKESRMTNKQMREAIDFIGSIMSETFKENEYLKRGLINACVRIAEVLSGDANNIVYYKFLGDATFAPYFGFTETEVKNLLEKKEFACCNHKLKDVKDWYNGYTSTVFTEAIYSCSSISRYLNESQKIAEPCFRKYWLNSGSMEYFKHWFEDPVVHESIEELINGKEIAIKAIERFTKDEISVLKEMIHQKQLESTEGANDLKDLFLQYLTENGYLNAVSSFCQTITIRVPNEEIRTWFMEQHYKAAFYRKKYKLSEENITNYQAAIQSVLARKDKNAFIEFAKAVSKLFDGAIMPEGEAGFSGILFVLAYNVAKYEVYTEQSIPPEKKRRGRPLHLDLLMVLEEAGLIVELKFDKQSSEAAFSQIKSRKYFNIFNEFKQVKKQIWMGLHMTKERQVSLTYNIDGSPPETITNLSPLEPVRNDPPAEPVVEDPPAETVSQEY